MKYFLLIFFLLLVFVTEGQRYNVKNFTTKQGLTSQIVNDVCEDKYGQIWFATQNGICFYDGKKFNTFDDESLTGLDVNTIISYNESIWFGVYGGGVVQFHNDKFIFYDESDGLPSKNTRYLFIDNKGTLWVATDGGVAKYIDKHFQIIEDPKQLFAKGVLCIDESKDGVLWFGTKGNGIVSKKNNEFEYFNKEDGIIDNFIWSIKSSGDSLLLGTIENGVIIKSNGSFKKAKIKGAENAWISSFLSDSDGSLLVVTSNGLFYQENNEFLNVGKDSGLLTNDLYSGHLDKFNNLWLTSGNGVSCILSEDIKLFDERNGLNGNNISSLALDKKKDLIVGLNYEGLSKQSSTNSNEFNNISVEQMKNTKITKVKYIKSKNELWVGSDVSGFGLIQYSFDGESYNFENQIESINNNELGAISDIKEDKEGKIYISTYGAGLFIIDEKDTILINKDNYLPSNNILTSFIDIENNLWLSISKMGVVKFDGKNVITFKDIEELNSTTIWAINQDDQGNMYFGTKTKGFIVFDGNDIKKFNVGKGILSNLIRAIQFDKFGNLWVGTDKGVNKIKLKKGKIDNITKYTSTNGLLNPEVVQDGIIIEEDFIWVCTEDGLFKFSNQSEEHLYVKPTVVINSIKLHFEDIFQNKNYNSLYTIINNKLEYSLNLDYEQNHLSFEFNSVTLNDVAYSYKLEGFDRQWSPLNEKDEVIYSNLPPGEYEFSVYSIDSYGVKSENVAKIKIAILPPFWQTWWFIGLSVISGIILIIVFIKLRLKRLVERQKLLEKTVDERTKEVVSQKKEVEKQRDEAERQKDIVQEKNKEISDSIFYAERIQRALLANEKMLSNYLEQYFIFFKPKDVVSGDFYWAGVLNNEKLAIVNADSTGHGVPGAIVSILNMTSLKESVTTGICQPNEILNNTRKLIVDSFANNDVGNVKDGMDCSIICIDKKNNILEFSAANNPVWIVREGELIEIKGDKMPIGFHDKMENSFTFHEFELKKNDVIYTLTDGFPDQFGGEKGKKYMYKKLKRFLTEISGFEMAKQKELLEQELINWMGDEEQIDDICLIGIRFPWKS